MCVWQIAFSSIKMNPDPVAVAERLVGTFRLAVDVKSRDYQSTGFILCTEFHQVVKRC